MVYMVRVEWDRSLRDAVDASSPSLDRATVHDAWHTVVYVCLDSPLHVRHPIIVPQAQPCLFVSLMADCLVGEANHIVLHFRGNVK